MNLKHEAERIAGTIRNPRAGWSKASWDELRDHCDLKTGGELDAIRLDILTDMVEARVRGVEA